MMRKKVRRCIASKSMDIKQAEEINMRFEKKNQRDIQVIDRYNYMNAVCTSYKSKENKEKAYKLMARGIPSHFYKNLNKTIT